VCTSDVYAGPEKLSEPEALNDTNHLRLYVFGNAAHRQVVLAAQLDNLGRPVELVDRGGRRLGHFVPAGSTESSAECPYSSEELARMREERGGRTLPQIWNSLEAE
jgi:hypothetical protein